MIPLRTAYNTISAVLCRLSFCMRLARWVSTVDRPEIEERGDFLVRPTLGQQLHDLFLAVRQQMVGVGQSPCPQPPHVVLDEDRGDGGAEEGFARGHGADGRKQVLVGGVLEQVGACACREGAKDVRLIGMHAENDHARRPVELLRARGHLDAVQFWHPDIENQQVGPMLLAESHRLETIGGFSDHGETRLLQQTSQSAANDAMVVSQQHAQARPPGQPPAAAAESPAWCLGRARWRLSARREAP